jgi:protein-L-isoaspartate(D-aspartate) O-methyltransferase
MDEWAADRIDMVKRQIERRGVRDPGVLEAMRTVPRHEFVPERERRRAYGDHPLPIGSSQTISQPFMVAVMTECLDLAPEGRVLEIGTGSGYQTAVLAALAGEVYTVERLPELSARARVTLTRLGYDNVHYRVADGSVGWAEEEPFDGILVTAAAPEVPSALVRQLADPGILAAPIGSRGSQDLVTVERRAGKTVTRTHFKCSFVPLLGAEGFPD